MSEEKQNTTAAVTKKQTTSPYDLFSTSEKNEQEGVAIDYGSFAIIVKRASVSSNAEFKKEFRRLSRKKGHAIELGTVSEDSMLKDMIDIFAKTVIVGWRDVYDREGNELPFNYANCVKLLTDLPELFRDIQAQAMSFETFREAEIEEVSKN